MGVKVKKILLILIFCFIIAISFSFILNNNKIDNLVLINESKEIFINNNVQKDKNLKSNKFITNILFSINRLNNNHTINYVLNGGINPNNAITTYKMYEEVTLPVPTKKNAIFMGWYIDSDYKNKITKIDKGNEENYNLYAKWEFNAKRNYEYSYYTNNNDCKNCNVCLRQLSRQSNSRELVSNHNRIGSLLEGCNGSRRYIEVNSE